MRAVRRTKKVKGVFELDELVHRLSFASRSDYQSLGKRLSSIKRRVRDLTFRIDAALGTR